MYNEVAKESELWLNHAEQMHVWSLTGSLEYVVERVKSLEKETAPWLGKDADFTKLELASAYDIAQLRLASNELYINNRSVWISENINYFPKEKKVVIAAKRNNPILKGSNPALATYCHRQGRELELEENIAKSLYDLAEKDIAKAKRSGALLLSEIPSFIPSNRLSEEAISIFLFGDLAKEYGLFLKKHGIKSVPIHVLKREAFCTVDKPFAKPFLLTGLKEGSAIVGDNGNLCSIASLFYAVRRIYFNGHGNV
ncbi:MAG: hypothetical protein QXU88_02565 [Candidatus Woesearchaeota archaeon]